MSYINALNLFELKDDYSIEELKQTYRALSKKYHPDYKQNASLEEQKESEEMMKRINEAYDILKNNLGKEKPKFNIETYKKEKIDDLDKIFNITWEDISKLNMINLRKYFEEIRKEIREGISYIQKNTNKIDVDYNYNITIDNIITIKKDLVNCFCKLNYIDKIPEKIDYTKPLSAFLSQLLSIKDKYSKESIFKRKVNLETQQYENYIGYNILIKYINQAKEKAINEAKNKQFGETSLNKIIENLHKNILNVFNIYAQRYMKINSLKEKIIKYQDDQKISKLFTTLWKNFQSDPLNNNFDDLYERLERVINIKEIPDDLDLSGINYTNLYIENPENLYLIQTNNKKGKNGRK